MFMYMFCIFFYGLFLLLLICLVCLVSIWWIKSFRTGFSVVLLHHCPRFCEVWARILIVPVLIQEHAIRCMVVVSCCNAHCMALVSWIKHINYAIGFIFWNAHFVMPACADNIWIYTTSLLYFYKDTLNIFTFWLTFLFMVYIVYHKLFVYVCTSSLFLFSGNVVQP